MPTTPLRALAAGITPGLRCDREQWLPVVGYEGLYEVSDHGNVRGLDRKVNCNGGTRIQRGTTIVGEISDKGYRRVLLWRSSQRKKCSVSALVAEAFFGPRPRGMEVCHNNGDSLDNWWGNLRYDTHPANIRDAVQHGTQREARKTQCPQGHDYDEENTLWVKTPSGRGRHCRRCHRDQQREYKARQRQTKVV